MYPYLDGVRSTPWLAAVSHTIRRERHEEWTQHATKLKADGLVGVQGCSRLLRVGPLHPPQGLQHAGEQPTNKFGGSARTFRLPCRTGRYLTSPLVVVQRLYLAALPRGACETTRLTGFKVSHNQRPAAKTTQIYYKKPRPSVQVMLLLSTLGSWDSALHRPSTTFPTSSQD